MKLVRVIEKNSRFLLSLVQTDEGQTQLMKTYAEDHPSLDAIAQLKNELKLSSRIKHAGIRRVFGETYHDKRGAILLEYIEGTTLRQKAPLDLAEFFRFAAGITETIFFLHQNRIFHRDISGHNILFDSENRIYKLIDLGTAIQLPASSKAIGITGTLTYSSPELSGRLDLVPDERADIYSLGVVFYEALTGINPFEDISDMQILYKHLAWLPDAPNKVLATIPNTLSAIVMKMLAKNPDDRYRSAKSVLLDLEEALLLFRRNVDPSGFQPGTADRPPPFNRQVSLTGYDREKEQLASIYQHFLGGNTQLTWLSGPHGSGKSTLINDLMGRILEDRVIYIRLDSRLANKPFAYLIDLFEQVFERINEETEEQLIKRKMRFNSEHLSNLSLLTDRVPALREFVRESSQDQEHDSIQSQNRIQLGMQDLLRVLSMPERPILVHVSDVSQTDSESLDFFRVFAEDIKEEFIWFVLETDGTKLPEDMHKQKILPLMGLGREHMESLLGQMAEGEINGKQKITDRMLKYAGNNPGKAFNLVKYWFESGFLQYDTDRAYWYWEDKADRDIYPETIMKAGQFEDPVLKEIIIWASVIDGKFTLALMTELCSFDIQAVSGGIERLLLQNQLVTIRNDGGAEQFRLSSAANLNEIIPDLSEQAERHLRLASLLSQHQAEDFRIAFHLNRAYDLGSEGFESTRALEINLRAGLKAKEEGAFHMARRYLGKAISHLDESNGHDSETLFKLYLNSAELALLEGEHDTAEDLFGKAGKMAGDDLQRAEIFSRQLRLFNHQGRLEDSYVSGREALRFLGFPISEKAGKMSILWKLISLYFRVGKKDPLTLVDLPETKNRKVILSLQILEDMHPTLFNKSSDLLANVILSSFEKILKYGNTPEGYSAYAGFGALLALGFGNYKKGWAFTVAGAEMTSRFQNKFYQGRGLYSKGAWIINYVDHTKESLPILEEGIKLSRESGDFSYATFGAMNLLEAYFMLGIPFGPFENKVDEHITFTHQIRYNDILALSLITKMYILHLTDREHEIKELSARWFRGEDLDTYTQSTSFKHIRIYYLILGAFTDFFMSRISDGLSKMDESRDLLFTLQGPAIKVDYYFILALLSYEASALKDDNKTAKHYSTLSKCLKKLQKYASLVEANYGHRYLVIKALQADLKGRHYESRTWMRQALDLARKYEYLQIEWIASAYLGKWFTRTDQRDYARLHLRDATIAAERWGATYLVRTMQEAYPDAILTRTGISQHSGGSLSSGSSSQKLISDPEVLMQSALSVSAETDFEALLDVMNKIFHEQTGANRSLLFINNGTELSLLYEMDGEKKSYYPFPGKNFQELERIPRSIIQLVHRSREIINIKDSSSEQRYRFERYFRESHPLSVLVTPMTYRGELSGIIYFENSMLTHAFSPDRQDLISLLSGQFAVALQNARLVEELEDRVAERTMALAQEKDRSDQLLKNILPAETAEELKHSGKATSRYYESVSVMFTDFIGFTMISEKLHPDEIVKMLDHYFREFDSIVKKHGLEKIKTIGDSYLCVAGLPNPMPDHAIKVTQAAFDILAFAERTRKQGKYGLELRIGIHSGPVVSGVVGEDKFAFDIWGDTVNTASRMETHSSSGMVNISRETMDLLAGHNIYTFEYRGRIPAKNKGEIDMYFVNESQEARPEYDEAIAYILDQLSQRLSDKLSYHSLEHTREIMAYSKMIGEREGISEEDMYLLQTAAAYHDSGFMYSPKEHEARGCQVVREVLPKFSFSEEHIMRIQKMIMATRIPQQPEDQLSRILCDADLYYLGTDDFYQTGNSLFEEFKGQGIVSSVSEWLQLQIRFLESHHYHTDTVIGECEERKQQHLAELREAFRQL